MSLLRALGLGRPPAGRFPAGKAPTTPRPEPAVISEIGHAEDLLNDLNEEAVDIIQHASGRVPPKNNRQGWPADPDGVIPGDAVGARRAQRAVVKTADVETELEAIEAKGGDTSKLAANLLDRIRGVRQGLRDLNAELLASRGQTPPTYPVKKPPPTGDLPPDVTEYTKQADEVKAKLAAIEAEEESLQKQAAQARKSFDSGKIDPDAFLKRSAQIEKSVDLVGARRGTLATEAASLEKQAESMVVKLGEAADLKSVFKTDNPQDILRQVRAGRGAALGGTVRALGALALGYFLVQSVRYVLDAKGGLAKVGRALEVGGTLAATGGLEALIGEIAESGVIGAAVVMALNVDDHNPIPAMEAHEKQDKQKYLAERHAVAAFLEKEAPGSVQKNGNVYAILDQDLFNKTLDQVHEMEAALRSKNLAKLMIRAGEVGAADGRSGMGFVHAKDMKDWDEVKKSDDPRAVMSPLLKQYEAGYKKGNSAQVALIERVRKIAASDGESGAKQNRDSLVSSQEMATFVKAGTLVPPLMAKIYAAYDESYLAATVRKAGAR